MTESMIRITPGNDRRSVIGLIVLALVYVGLAGTVRAGEPGEESRVFAAAFGSSQPNPVMQARDNPRSAGGARNRSTRKPRSTPKPKPTTPGRNRGKQNTPAPSANVEKVRGTINLEAEELLKPAEERSYNFSLVDGTYANLVENFARMSGLGVIGDAPQGQVSFVSTQEMDFRSALNRVRMLLFKFSPIEPYWLMYEEEHLEVLRVNDVWRVIDQDKYLFMNVADFRAAQKKGDLYTTDLAMVLYTPTDTSVSDFTMLRDFMPDYVRIAPMGGTNSMAIFALVSDIEKYLSLIKLFEGAGEDPRVLIKLAVNHLIPSVAVTTLNTLMDDLQGVGGAKRPRGRVQDPTASLPGEQTVLFPDDNQGVLIVRAIPRVIKDIEEMLAFIDVQLDAELSPVVIPIRYARVDEVRDQIHSLISASGGVAGKSSTAKPRRNKGGKRGGSSAPIVTEGLLLLANSRTNELIVRGTEDEVSRVRRYIRLFDVPADSDKPVIVSLQHVSPEDINTTITQIVQGQRGKRAAAERPFNCYPEPVSGALILVGAREDVEAARDLIAIMDVAAATPTLHAHRLENASPSVVMDLITILDAPGAPSPGGKRPPRGRKASGSTWYVDNTTNTIYMICTDDEWNEKYFPVIKQMDEDAAEIPSHVLIEVKNLASDEAVNILREIFAPGAKGANAFRIIAASNGIVVDGASPAKIEHIREVLADIDIDSEGRQRRIFTLEFADPNEIKTVIDSGIVGSGRVRRVKRPQPGAVPGVITTVVGDLLIVSASADELLDIEELVKQLDVVSESERSIRVYSVPPGFDVESIATQLEQLIRTTAPSGARRRTKNPASQGTDGSIQIVSQPISRKILIRAPEGDFSMIEESYALLTADAEIEPVEIRFFPVEHVDPGDVANMIEPFLQMRAESLIKSGELRVEPDVSKRSAITTVSTIRVSADLHGDRVLVAGPTSIILEAEQLIREIDQPPASTDDRILRTIELSRTTPDQMITTIKAMINSGSSSPRKPDRPRRPRIRKSKSKSKSSESGSALASATSDGPLDVTIASAPGGNAVIVSGDAHDVDEVEAWIRKLDGEATGSTVLKIYNIVNAEVEEMADTIMALCDSGSPGKSKPKDDDFSFYEPNPVRKGADITLTTDYWNKRILVRATPAKIYEIDQIIELYEGKEGEEPEFRGGGENVPLLFFELAHADPFDAEYQLESILPVVWTHSEEIPDIDYIPGTQLLVVKAKTEYHSEIKGYITKYIDKLDEEGTPDRVVKFKDITGMTASDMAGILKSRLPHLNVDLIQIGEDIPQLKPVGPYSPPAEAQPQCVLPASLAKLLSVTTISQAPSGRDNEKEKAATKIAQAFVAQSEGVGLDGGNSDTNSDATGEESVADEPITIRFDDRTGVIALEGAPKDVDAISELVEELIKQRESSSRKMEVRVYRVRYRDVNEATNVLMNALGIQRATQANRGNAAAQAAQLRRQMQQMQRAQKAAGGRPGAQPNAVPQPNIDPRTGMPMQEEKKEDSKKSGLGDVRITPDPKNRFMIITAATEDFPVIVELLATIDRPSEVDKSFKIYKLTKLIASDVEGQLKELLGISAAKASTRRPTANPGTRNRRGGNNQNRANQQIEDALMQFASLGANGGTIDVASDVTVTSNPSANTLLVNAPEPVHEIIAEFIKDLEAQDIPTLETRTYRMTHSDVAASAEQLTKMFSQRKGDAGYDPNAVNKATFTADPRTNTLIVQAFDTDFDKIEPLITKLDEDMGDDADVLTFKLEYADATQTARTLNEVYGQGGGKRGAKGVKIVGDPSSNTLFVTAPQNQRDDISARIIEIDAQAADVIEPRTIKIVAGDPDKIAQSLKTVFTSGGGKSGKGAITIVGDSVGGQVIVSAPDDVFNKIESLTRKMDQSTIGEKVNMRVFKLEHAQAVEVHGQIMNLVRQMGQQLGPQAREMGVFTAVPDERSNAILCMGSPISFVLVEKAIKEVDVPPTDATQVVTAIYRLVHADATELASNITRIFTAKRGTGVEPPKAEANRSNNILIVRGTESQIKQINEEVIKPVEDKASGHNVIREIVALEHADAADIARILNENMNKMSGGQRKGQPISVIANAALNSIVINGAESDVTDLVTLASDLDKEPSHATDRSVRNFPLAHTNPWVIADAIRQIYRPKRGPSNPADEVVAIAEGTAMAVIVSASQKNMARVTELIAELDKPGASDSDVHVVEIKHADAASVAQSLTQLFVHGGGGRNVRGQSTIQITNPRGSDMLLIKANQTELDRILAVVEDLDQSSGNTDEIKMIVLKNTDADMMQQAMENYLRKPGQRGGELVGDVRMTANTQNNTLMVSGDPEEVARIEGIISNLDVEVEGAANAPRIIQLEHARASQIQPTLDEMFGQASGKGKRGRNNKTEAPIIVADDASNTLLVRARPTDFAIVEDLVEMLDKKPEEDREPIRIVSVAEGVKAADMADLIQSTVNESERIRAEQTGGDAATIVVSAYPRGNGLILAGSPALFENATKLIRDLETMGVTGGNSVRILKTKNISASEIQRLLNQVIDENGRSSGTSSGVRRSGGRNNRSSGRGSNTRRLPRRNSRGGRR